MKVRQAPERFRNPIGRYIVLRDVQLCAQCGTCMKSCPAGVFTVAGRLALRPKEWLCPGPCSSGEHACVAACPAGAITVRPNPLLNTLGDFRWPSDLILDTWEMARTGSLPAADELRYNLGLSGGGFDRIRLRFPEKPAQKIDPEQVYLGISLNRREHGQRVDIGVPYYGGGMSFGSVSSSTMTARAMAAQAVNSMTCTGEGGYPPELYPYDKHVITQVATGLFGVSEETIQRVRMVEFKYAQGAKPGLGGHLLGDKVTAAVARMREVVKGSALFSPFPFHSVYSVEDHKKHVDWIRAINPEAVVSVKVSTPTDVDMVAVGSYYAEAQVIHLDGCYGGTGAAPDIAKKNIAMPIEYAIPKVHRFLKEEGVREQMALIASGGIRGAHDIIKAVALGADGVVIGTSDMVALGCIRCGACESGRGCARGIATTDDELAEQFDPEWGAQRIFNLYNAWNMQLRQILAGFGLGSIRELVGRTEFLTHLDYVGSEAEANV